MDPRTFIFGLLRCPAPTRVLRKHPLQVTAGCSELPGSHLGPAEPAKGPKGAPATTTPPRPRPEPGTSHLPLLIPLPLLLHLAAAAEPETGCAGDRHLLGDANPKPTAAAAGKEGVAAAGRGC